MNTKLYFRIASAIFFCAVLVPMVIDYRSGKYSFWGLVMIFAILANIWLLGYMSARR